MSEQAPTDVSCWLVAHGLEKYAPAFEAHEIGLAELPELTESHLVELGLPMGPRIRLLKAVAQSFGVPSSSPPAATIAAASERRPVTVMFCDIVGSVKLTSALDPEATRGVMLRYWRLVEETAARHLGHIAQHLGDGALIYFGYPEARENDAERAVLAGLALRDQMAALDAGAGTALQVRIGIATGTVVLNEFSRQAGAAETLAIGHSVHLASRLQTLAEPDTVVIDGPTHDLVQGLFKIGLQAEMPVAGVDEPVKVFCVHGVAQIRSRFEARRSGTASSGGATSFLGRTGELNLLLNRWDAALASLGQLVLVTGEPGIGKSRLLAEAAERMVQTGHLMVQLQCSPNATGTPLQPVVEWLVQTTGLAPGDRQPALAAKVRARFGELAADPQPLLDLLDRGANKPAGDPQLRRLSMLSTLAELFSGMAAVQPLLLMVEDLHWCDPTTLEFLQRLLARVQNQALLLLATARPEFKHDFGRGVSRTDIALPRLDRSHADALMKQVLGAQQISTPLLDMVQKVRFESLVAWAGVRRLRGRSDDAIDALGQALVLVPDHLPTRMLLGQLLLETDQVQACRALVDGLPVDLRTGAWADVIAGLIAYGAKDWPLAAVHFHRLALAGQAPINAPGWLGWTLLMQARWAEAENWFGVALTWLGERGRTHEGLGMALDARGRAGDAAESFLNAIGEQPANARLHMLRAGALERTGHFERAQAAYWRALSLDPSLTAGYERLAHLTRLALGEHRAVLAD